MFCFFFCIGKLVHWLFHNRIIGKVLQYLTTIIVRCRQIQNLVIFMYNWYYYNGLCFIIVPTEGNIVIAQTIRTFILWWMNESSFMLPSIPPGKLVLPSSEVVNRTCHDATHSSHGSALLGYLEITSIAVKSLFLEALVYLINHETHNNITQNEYNLCFNKLFLIQ